MFTLCYFSIPGWLDLFVYSVAFTHWHLSFALWIEIFIIMHVESLIKTLKLTATPPAVHSTVNVSFPVLFWDYLWGPCSEGSEGEQGQGDITRCDTQLRVAVTTVQPHQSHLSDRCTPVCVWLCQVPVLTEDGDEGQDGWSTTGKNNHLKFITYRLCCCLCSLCSESSGHDDHHRRLGLANVSLTWGKNKLSAEVFVWV